MVGVRFTEDEHAKLQAQAEAARVDISTLARAVLLNEPIPAKAKKATADEKELARMLATLGKIGGNLNQIARIANTTGDPAQPAALRQIAQEMTALRELLLEAMER